MSDAYETNPLAIQAQRTYPERYAEVSAFKDAPKMFAGGKADYPAFTASGIDPTHLLRLPYGVRHAAAAEPDINRVYEIFATYEDTDASVLADNPEIFHPGLEEARGRIRRWLEETDTDPRSPEQRQADFDAEYASFFPVDVDRISWANEQKRRERDGEEPLEDFQVLVERRRLAEQAAANTAGGPQ